MSASGYLSRFPLFAGLSEADLALLERVMVVDRYTPGHVFVREGERTGDVRSAVYLILEGTVEVVARAPAGAFGVRRTMGEGQLFGLVGLVADVPRTATCTAAGTVRCARLDRLSFQELYRRDVGTHARFQLAVARQLAADLRGLRGLLTDAIATGDVTPLRNHLGG